MMMNGGRDAALGAAVRPPALAVEWRTDVNPYHRSSTICLIVTRMSLLSSPVCCCGALPQPRSSNALAADTRAGCP